MKLRVKIGLTVAGLIMNWMVYSQSDNCKVTITMSDVTVEEVFNIIKKQTLYSIVYNDNDVVLTKRVNINIKNKPVKEAMRQVLAGQNVSFVITGNYIVLSKQDIPINVDSMQKIKPNVDNERTGKGVILGEVVVTALGIRRNKKELTYSTQQISGNELTRIKDPNLITTLAGKTAGVQINRSASGLGGSAKVIIRGNRSVAGNNQPLYVIDGIPVNNTVIDQTATSIGGTNDAGNRDGGDGISNLNPDDIENLNILKGPTAAALYGSQAANGVILITTKKGKAGKTSISFNSSISWDMPAYGIPKFQNSYTGKTSSWGRALQDGSPDYTQQFFKTGMTTIHSLSFSSGTEQLQNYFSYANTCSKGVIEGNNLMKHNLNFREVSHFFNEKLILDANVALFYQKLNNENTPGGYYNNPLVGLYRFPRGGVDGSQSFDYYRNNYWIYNQQRNLNVQNWYVSEANGMEQNPYWLIYKTPKESMRTRGIANMILSGKLNQYFTLQARGNMDFFFDRYNQKMYVGTSGAITGENGRYIVYEATNQNTYGDLLLSYRNKYMEKLSLSFTAGSSIADQQTKSLQIDSRPGDLYKPNVFTIANIQLDNGYIIEQVLHRQDQAVFFAGQLGYDESLFLDVTARNEWSSTLAFTRSAKNGFFYPSAGIAWLFNKSLALPEAVNLAKVKLAWSQVGNALQPYISNPTNKLPAGGGFQSITVGPFSELKPERTSSLEGGMEGRFWNNKITLDITIYKTNTTNQLFTLPAASGSGFSYLYVNAGNIENRGIEIMTEITPLLTKDYCWTTAFNYSANRNKVLELNDRLNYFIFGQDATHNYQMRLKKNGSFGDIYGITFLRDEQNNIVYDDLSGLPLVDTKQDLNKVANCLPKGTFGWSNTLSYNNLSLYFLVDGRLGGEVLSMTQADLDAYGVSKATGDARKAGYVTFDEKTIGNVAGFFQMVGGRSGITEYYVYSATNIRLREAALSYRLPTKICRKSGLIQSAELVLTGRNLFFIRNDAPYDPDAVLSTGNNLQGIDVFGMPTNRSIGVDVKLQF
jgi:TonB-linked SusC/RagA family outer membrane protein